MQEGHLITYFNNRLTTKMNTTLTYIKELFSISHFVFKWGQYLLGTTFLIWMDHKSFKELSTQVIQTQEKKLYIINQLDFDFKIKHKQGRCNLVVDALLRINEN